MAANYSVSPGPYQISRTQFVPGDPLRSTVVVWRWYRDPYSGPSCNGQYSLVGDTTHMMAAWKPATHEPDWYEPYMWNSFQVPESVPDGTYRLWVTDPGQPGPTDTGIDIDVYRPVTNNTRDLAPNIGDDTQQVEDLLKTHDIFFLPGTFTFSRRRTDGWTDPLWLTADRRLVGSAGTVFKFVPSTNEPDAVAMVMADNVTFENITFDFPRRLAWNDTVGKNCVFKNCTFLNGQTGLWDYENNRFEECRFHHATLGPINNRVMLNECEFRGISHILPGHEFFSEGGLKTRICAFGTKFYNTGRGFIWRTGWGPCSDGLYCSTVIREACELKNTELILTEGNINEVARNIVIRFRAYDNESVLNFYNAPSHDNVFWDGVVENTTFNFSGHAPQTGNNIRAFEFRGGGVNFGDQATDNVIEYSAFLNWTPKRGNQFSPDMSIYDKPGPVEAIGPGAATNVVKQCRFIAMAPGAVDVTGATVV